MAEIDGLTARVLRNSTEIEATSVGVSYENGKLGSQWNIELREPIEIVSTDTWSVILEFAGYERYLVKNALAENYGADDEKKRYSRRVSSRSSDIADADILSDYGAPKTLVFVNREWLKGIDNGAYIDGNTGVVMTKSTVGGAYADPTRFYHPSLPGKDHDVYPDGTYDFECHFAESHHDVARQLCRMIGIKCYVNTPDIPLIDTCTVNSGTRWFDAIKQNFMIWSPQINTFLDQDENQTIAIEDILSQTGATGGLQIVAIDNPAIVSFNRGLSRPSSASDKLVDHLIITGRKTKDTLIGFEDRPDYTPIEIPAVEVAEDYRIETSFEQADLSQHKSMGSYSGSFGVGDDQWTVQPVITTRKEIGIKTVRKGDRTRRIPVSEYDYAYDVNGLVSKTEAKHYYSPDLTKIVKTVEKCYFKTNMPGTETKSMELLRTKTTLQNYVIRPLNLTMTEEMIEDKLIYDELATSVGGSPTIVKVDPKPLVEILRSDPNYVEKDPNTSQKTMEMTTYRKSTYIDRCDEHTLVKTDRTYNILSKNLPSFNSQILDNPHKDPPVSSKDNVFRREYKNPRSQGRYINGKGPFYHPAKTISHRDICTDDIAEKIRDRTFYRKNLAVSATLWEIGIQVPVPVPLDYTGTKIRLSELVREVDGQDVTIPGGDYFMKRVDYRLVFKARKDNAIAIDFNETVTVGSQL